MKNLLVLTILFIIHCGYDCKSQNIWEATSGPNGLDIADIIFTSENVLVVSARNSGVYFSKDKGLNWQKIHKGLETPTSHARCLAAGTNGIVYAIFDHTLYRLENNSDEWIRLNYSIAPKGIILTNPQGYLYIITYDVNIFYSVDNGNNFKQILKNINFQGLGQALFHGNENNFLTVIEGGGAAVYRMNDDGTGLKKILHVATIEIFWHPAGYLFGFAPNVGLVRMDRDGMNQIWNNTFLSRIQKILINSNGKLLVFTDEGDYESDDIGLNYMKNPTLLFEKITNKSDVYFFNDEVYIYNYLCETGEFEKSNDTGKTWITLEQTFSNSLVKDIFIDKLGRLFSKTCDIGKYSYSLDRGNNWMFLKLPSNVKPSNDLVSSSTGNLFILMDSKIYRSVDLGINWTILNLPTNNYFNRLKGDNEDRIYAFGISSSLYSKDRGENWTSIANTPSPIDKLYFHPDGTVFAISNSTIDPHLYSSEDEGLHWNEVNPEISEVNSFCISKTGNIYFSGVYGTGYGTYLSQNKLKTVTKLTIETYNALTIDDTETIYATFQSKCQRSLDGGKAWEYFQTGLPVLRNYTSLALDDKNYLYIGIDNDVVYKTTKSVTSTNNFYGKNSELSITIQPNPVENELTVKMLDAKISAGQYRIFDINGVERLYGEFHSNNFKIDCITIPNGMMILHLFVKAELFLSTKIIIAK